MRASELDDPALVSHGIRFARFFYGRDHELGYPDVGVIEALDPEIARALRDLVRHSLSLRATDATEPGISNLIRSYMLDNHHSHHAYRSLRRVFRQPQGPSAAGLLASVPLDYLRLIESTLSIRLLASKDVVLPHVTQDGGES